MQLRENGLVFSDGHSGCPDSVVLYRHTKLVHAERLVRDGFLRMTDVGTYRDTLAFGSEIGDSAEGTKTRDTMIRSAMVDEQGKVYGDSRIRELVPIGPTPHGASFCNVLFQNEHVMARPTMCWCLTDDADLATARKMNPDYDATLELTVSVYTLRQIRQALQAAGLRVRGVGLGKVAYVSRRHTGDRSPYWHYPPTLIKDQRYSYQREWRVFAECELWHPLPPSVDIAVAFDIGAIRLSRHIKA